jgi:hypothetical protein
MKEVWKPVPGYESLYLVSNMGRIKSLPRLVSQKYRPHMTRETVLRPQTRRHGYLSVWLYRDGTKRQESVHRIVAEVFCEKLPGRNEVNHINEDKQDNRAENLEWCTHKANVNSGTVQRRRSERIINNPARSKKIAQITLEGKLVRVWPSLAEASRNGFASGNISKCARGSSQYSHAYGYLWRYVT